jgi:hypothetical protein
MGTITTDKCGKINTGSVVKNTTNQRNVYLSEQHAHYAPSMRLASSSLTDWGARIPRKVEHGSVIKADYHNSTPRNSSHNVTITTQVCNNINNSGVINKVTYRTL